MKKSNNGGFRWLCSQFRSKLSSLTFLIGANVLGAYLGTVFAVAIQEVIDKKLGVVDMAASILCMENKMPMLVFGLNEENSIVNTVKGKFKGTKVTV